MKNTLPKNRTEYDVYRLYQDTEPDYWDGPFTSLKAAQNALRELSKDDRFFPDTDFCIGKVVTTFQK